jgi:hypothetical protein
MRFDPDWLYEENDLIFSCFMLLIFGIILEVVKRISVISKFSSSIHARQEFSSGSQLICACPVSTGSLQMQNRIKR